MQVFAATELRQLNQLVHLALRHQGVPMEELNEAFDPFVGSGAGDSITAGRGEQFASGETVRALKGDIAFESQRAGIIWEEVLAHRARLDALEGKPRGGDGSGYFVGGLLVGALLAGVAIRLLMWLGA